MKTFFFEVKECAISADESGAILSQYLQSNFEARLSLSIEQLPQLAEALLAAYRQIAGVSCALREEGAADRPPVTIPSRVEKIDVSVFDDNVCICQPLPTGEGQAIHASPDQIELLCAQLRAGRDALWAKRTALQTATPADATCEPVTPR